MKKILTFCALLAAAVPLVALAAFTRPSEALKLLSYDGKPRTFSAQVYIDAEGTAATITVDGAVEGKRPEDMKMKLRVAADVTEEGAWLATIKAQALVYREQLYVLLEDIAVREGEEMPAEGVGQWYVLPLTSEDMQAQEWEDIAEEFVIQLRDVGVEVTVEEITQALTSVVDALFTMEHTQYAGGHAYSMRLHPNFLRNAVETVSRFLLEHGNEDVRTFVREMQQGLMMEPDTLAETESQVRQMLNLHLKMDTNTSDEFVFGKYYVSFIVPDMDVHVALQGGMQRQMTPVYLEIPRDALPVGEATGDIPELLREFLNSASQEFGPTWFDVPGEEEEIFWEDSWEEEEFVPAPRIPRVPRTLDRFTRQRRRPMMPQVSGCNSEPGTRAYVRMQRNGVCPAVNWKYVR